MSNVPAGLRYTESHEWARLEADGTVSVGITDHAQRTMGDMVFVEMPTVGKAYEAGDSIATVESVKAASDIYAPVSGTVTAVNEEISDSPEIINEDPYGSWIYRLRPSAAADYKKLLDATAYKKLVAE
jgi:glycine cleavage system H protein